MSRYNVKLNTSIREMAHTYSNKQTEATRSRDPKRDLHLIDDSLRPLKEVVPRYNDPVYNISMQNATAQPGSGATQIPNSRNDLAELLGRQSHKAVDLNINMSNFKQFHPSQFASGESAAYAQSAYFNAGKRIRAQLPAPKGAFQRLPH
jgi:hypothetical protein